MVIYYFCNYVQLGLYITRIVKTSFIWVRIFILVDGNYDVDFPLVNFMFALTIAIARLLRSMMSNIFESMTETFDNIIESKRLTIER